MIKNYFIGFALLCASGFYFLQAEEVVNKGSSLMELATDNKENMRRIEFVNDIPDLIKGLPEETEEFQESVYYTIELDGVMIKPGQVMMVPVYDNHVIITIQSKKPLIDHLDSVSEKVKKFAKKPSSFITAYYCFVCHLHSDVEVVHLAIPVLYGCDELKKKAPYKLSYKWPCGIKICLKEVIELS